MTTMSTLEIAGPCVAEELELGRTDLAGVPDEQRVPDVATLIEGRAGTAVRLSAIAALAGVSPAARFVHVASEDGGFTANIDLPTALEGLILYEHDGQELPRSFGGPFRLLFADSEDCSVNVKFLGRIEFVEEPGSHTARCED